jgi:hypothetical protein
MVPVQWARSVVISQRRSDYLQSGTTPQAWYCPRTSDMVTPAPRRRLNTTQ